jgi:DUF1680 family protein
VDFRLPAGAKSMEIKINGARQKPEPAAAGFFRVEREWKPGDRVALKFDFVLRAHFQTASDGARWIAFSWGPLALAQNVIKQTEHPQNVLVIERESDDGAMWLNQEIAANKAPASADNATEELDTNAAAVAAKARPAAPSWRLKTPRKIILVPYFQAGAEGGGVRTMFPTRRTPLENR